MSYDYPQFEKPGDELRDEEYPDDGEPTMDDEEETAEICPKCGATVFHDLDECPHCGTPLEAGRFGNRGLFWAVVSVIVLLAFLATFVF